LDVAHQAVRWIETRVQPANWDGQMAWTMVIFPPGIQTDDSKLTAQDITNFVNRGDIK